MIWNCSKTRSNNMKVCLFLQHGIPLDLFLVLWRWQVSLLCTSPSGKKSCSIECKCRNWMSDSCVTGIFDGSSFSVPDDFGWSLWWDVQQNCCNNSMAHFAFECKTFEQGCFVAARLDTTGVIVEYKLKLLQLSWIAKSVLQCWAPYWAYSMVVSWLQLSLKLWDELGAW